MTGTAKKRITLRHPLKMADVSDKPIVKRVAEVEGKIWLKPKTIARIREGPLEKGDVFSAGNVAGILAAKKTPELIPLCHPIPLSQVDVSFSIGENYVTARCRVVGEYKTGVEMEALVGVTTALLTVWDMVKYLEKDENGQYPNTEIGEIRVLRKKKEAMK